MRLRLVAASAVALAVVPALASCSGGGSGSKQPPITEEPNSRPTAPPLPPKQALAARMVVFTFLRGVGSGDAKVCGLLAPEYQRLTFGKPGGCRTGFGAARKRFRPKDLTALRTVIVPTGEAGPGLGDYTVRFEDLKWKGDPARPGGVLAAVFTLHLTGKTWRIVG